MNVKNDSVSSSLKREGMIIRRVSQTSEHAGRLQNLFYGEPNVLCRRAVKRTLLFFDLS